MRRFRLYIDESGDHTFKLADDDNHRYLGLLGIWFDVEGPYRAFADSLQALKRDIFGWHPDDQPICLHRKDVIERRGVFGRLRDPGLNARFEERLSEVIRSSQFHMTCVVIDKAAHRTKAYSDRFHPYHFCVAALLERYAGWLKHGEAQGDVMAESRGRTEDRELAEAFENALHSAEQLQGVLTSRKIKLKKKEHAIAGLELADLLAYPFKREMVAERRGKTAPADFSASILEIARKVAGYGKVWLG